MCKCDVLPLGGGGGAHLLPAVVRVEDYQDDTEEEDTGDNEED